MILFKLSWLGRLCLVEVVHPYQIERDSNINANIDKIIVRTTSGTVASELLSKTEVWVTDVVEPTGSPTFMHPSFLLY